MNLFGVTKKEAQLGFEKIHKQLKAHEQAMSLKYNFNVSEDHPNAPNPGQDHYIWEALEAGPIVPHFYLSAPRKISACLTSKIATGPAPTAPTTPPVAGSFGNSFPHFPEDGHGPATGWLSQ